MRLPPFSALRALEAACRRQSFTLAAEELHVTHGAVSHQIRRLEDELGVALFRRQARRMVPTEPALSLAAAVAQALRVLEKGVADAAPRPADRRVVISLAPSFARYWLSPRLRRLAEAAPDVALDIRTERRLADFRSDGVDVAIRHGVGPWPGLHQELLFALRLAPVCSAAFVEEHGVRDPADLLRLPLLDEDDVSWAVWFECAGLTPPQRRPAATAFDDSTVMLDAAAAGLGVALASDRAAEADLASGRLVRPFDLFVEEARPYNIVWRADVEPRPAVRAVLDFLRREAALARG
jgi:LysR family transcriptional regulator, glycine cleavage system transcriptional activator